MAYFRNKSRAAAAEVIVEPENNITPPVALDAELDEDGLRREPDVDELQRETVAPAEPPDAPAEPPQAEQQAAPQDSEASEVLRSQMEAIKRYEAIQQRQQAAAAAEQKRVDWLAGTPMARANYGALGVLHHEALKAGFDDLSEDYFRYLESGLAALEPPQEQSVAVEPSMPIERPPAAAQPTPEFFRPPPAPRMPAQRPVAVSAPVSRSIPSSDRDRLETNPNLVKLSPAELEIARSSGISPTEYARGKQRLEREKREGHRQNG